VNYRSDPPLPVADIQALLFLGRTPATSGPNAALTNPALQSALTGNTVLQQAMSATSGSRLERFFGAARLKFDPQSGSVEQNSSARLTLEQQVARDVTLTYITSLNNTQQQIVQVEWAVSPRVSLLAVRDQNGLFGIDLRWKKRFR
jgi:translocation and assembly module TamB